MPVRPNQQLFNSSTVVNMKLVTSEPLQHSHLDFLTKALFQEFTEKFRFDLVCSFLSPLSWSLLPLLHPATSRSTSHPLTPHRLTNQPTLPHPTLPRLTPHLPTLPQHTRITNTPTSQSPANLMNVTSMAAANGGTNDP